MVQCLPISSLGLGDVEVHLGTLLPPDGHSAGPEASRQARTPALKATARAVRGNEGLIALSLPTSLTLEVHRQRDPAKAINMQQPQALAIPLRWRRVW